MKILQINQAPFEISAKIQCPNGVPAVFCSLYLVLPLKKTHYVDFKTFHYVPFYHHSIISSTL